MTIGSKIANTALNSSAMKYLTAPNAASAAATLAMISNISKDGVNCYYYVTQSLKNEKIPEEKRKFVASLDLSNGILNIITQLAVGIPVIKMASKIFDNKIAPKYFSKKAAENMYKKINPKMSLEKFYGRFSRNRSLAKTGMGVITTLVATQVFAKRVIVPLIATPMASFFKKKMEKGNAVQAQSPGCDRPENSQNMPECFKNLA